MQTILGSGGTIGKDLAKELHKFTSEIRLVSRKPVKVNTEDQLFPADLTDEATVDKAIEGSDVVYLVIGLEYSTKVWKEKWPVLMRAVITACRKHQAKLVFFDNMYMYDKAHLAHMTEETAINPTSKKGAIRAQIAQLILDEVEKKTITALIARSGDFYGPGNEKSYLIETVYKNMKIGKRGLWFADANKKHTFTYTPDAAKATATLGNTPDAYNQVWHLPTHKDGLTGKEWVALFARELKVAPKITVIPAWLVGILGLFIPFMKEIYEMLYQYDRDYIFDSTKFTKRFNFTPISNEEAVKRIVVLGRK